MRAPANQNATQRALGSKDIAWKIYLLLSFSEQRQLAQTSRTLRVYYRELSDSLVMQKLRIRRRQQLAIIVE